MRKIIFISIISSIFTLFHGCCCLPSPGKWAALVQVSAQVVEYMPLAMHEEYEGPLPDQWYDAIVLKIISPEEWAGNDLNVYFDNEIPSSHPMREIGSIWEFKVEKREIVGKVPNLWPPNTVNEYLVTESCLKNLKKIEPHAQQ